MPHRPAVSLPRFCVQYLEDFYRDKKRYGFPLQVYLLNRRFKQHQQIIWSGAGAVQDRTIYEDTVFAKVSSTIRRGPLSPTCAAVPQPQKH